MPLQPFTNPYITQEQAQAIVDVLVQQCDKLEKRNADDRVSFPELYDEDYERGRTHSDTAAVLAGFQPGTAIPNMSITKRCYGRIHCQPELESDSIIVQIYSANAKLGSGEILGKCAEYNTSESKKKYCIIQFKMAKKGYLASADLLMLDNKGTVTLREAIYKHRAKIIRASA